MPHLIQRGKRKTWHLWRRVPKRFEHLETGRYFTRSLKTESLDIAEEKARQVWQTQLTIWEARLAGHDENAAVLHKHLVNIAERQGFPYRPAEELAKAPLSEIIGRIEATQGQPPEVQRALLGTDPRPRIALSQLFDTYQEIVAIDQRAKSPAQVRKWVNDRTRALRSILATTGDLDALAIDRSAAMRHRSALASKIEAGKLAPYSANREMIAINVMVRTVAKAHGLDPHEPFTGLLFKDPKRRRRHVDMKSFPTDWIAQHILHPHALPKLNKQARAILQMVACIGARPSEICALTASTIHLAEPVPFISIEPDGREVKSAAGVRRIPLTGRALKIAQAHAQGFPRYLDKAAGWSAVVNKQLREKTPLPSKDHTAYSLRHSFRDRLREVGCPDTLADQIFGHAETGTVYGEGASLAAMRDWLDRIEINASQQGRTPPFG